MTMSASRVCILMLVASLRVAFGGIITLDAASRGWLQPVAPFNNGTSAGNNYLAGFCGPGDCVSNSSEFRDFFQFSIPSLSDTIVSARLLLDTVVVITPDPSETYQVTSIPTSFVFADLGTGTLYGSAAYTTSDTDTNKAITLNAAALAAIVSGTTFGVGGRITTLSGQTAVDELIFGNSASNNTTRLEITTSDVPEPANWILLGIGLVAVALKRRGLV
jgi:hypothetical protein